MQPFLTSEAGKQLKEHYLQPTILLMAARTMHSTELEGVIRLWLSEGIPYAFQASAMKYEAIRGWLARRLGIHPKAVTLIGSARTGYSLAPSPKYGAPFGSHSDLDFAVSSELVFSQLCTEVEQWRAETAEGRIHPRTPAERKYWRSNLQELPINISRGFVDSYKIPLRYPTSQKIGQAKYLLARKIGITPDVPQAKRVSIRVYRDWDTFIRQMKLNLLLAVQSIAVQA